MIKKVILPIAGLGTRFLPLSKVLPKEFWPIVGKPVIELIVDEAIASGVKEIIFVISSEKKPFLNYFQESSKINDILKERKKDDLLEELKKIEEKYKKVSFSYAFQKKPLGDGHAVMQAAKLANGDSCGVLFGDDIVYSKEPCLEQLANIFKTCQKPVIALKKVEPDKVPLYGIVEGEKIANRLYKIKKIVEKPSKEKAPSNLAIVGKYIITPLVFDYLKSSQHQKTEEIILANAFENMIKEGKTIYGYEFDGEWLECGNIYGWLKSNLFLGLKHPKYGEDLKKFLKEI